MLMAAMIKLNGDYFGKLLSTTTAQSRLVAALIADLSRMFKVASSRMEIQGLALGSLLVNYSIALNTSESVAQAASLVTTTTTTLSQSQGQSVMTETSALYVSDAVPAGVSAAPITVASTAVTYVNTAAVTVTTAAGSNSPPSSSGSSAECGGISCGLVVGGAVALAVICMGAVAAGLIINSRRNAKAKDEFRQNGPTALLLVPADKSEQMDRDRSHMHRTRPHEGPTPLAEPLNTIGDDARDL
jgi:hypothetical protein